MDLRSIRARNYKTILDSGWATVDPQVTCLIGKNESGKTTLLETLYRLKPARSAHPADFAPLRDYPRRHYARDKAGVADLATIHATFELSSYDLSTLFEEFGEGCLTSTLVTATKGYPNRLTWHAEVDETVLLNHVKIDKRLSGVDVTSAATMDQLRERLNAIEYPTAPLQEIRQYLELSPHERLLERLGELLPPFIYFSHYDVLPGVVSVQRLQTVAEDELAPGERTALSLLRLAGVESEEFDEASYEARKAALEAAANTLTDAVFEYWTQDDELQIELDIEFRRSPGSATPPEPFLQIRIRNNRHRVTLNFAERSAGFVWFFSFLAYFSEFRNADERHILLLDEPGLNLHGAAQNDLLRYIDEHLAPDHQVIYTTHSPFMIQAERLERARFVEEVDQLGTIVRDDAAGSSDETQLPLHTAIGNYVTRHLFSGRPVLIVEGTADLVYLRTLSRHLREQKRACLDERCVILPVGGLDLMATVMALLSPQVSVVALHDAPRPVPAELQRLVDRKAIDASQLLAVTEASGGRDAGIEELFDQSFYRQLLDTSGTASIPHDIKGQGRVIARIEAELGHQVSRYAPAQHLAVHADELLPMLPAKTLDRFESLFKTLNDRLPSPG